MPSAKLTDEQHAAVTLRDVSIALSAGAGCGKTHVLTERFLSHLEPPADGAPPTRLEQLIAITFTDAAAREMRSRIRAACFERLRQATTDKEQSHWLHLLREVDAARISTIHALCAALLRTHAAIAGLEPTFAVMDQGEADVLQSQVIDDVLRDRLAMLDEDALDLADSFGLARLKQQILTLLARRYDPAFHHWLTATPREVVCKWKQWYEGEAFPAALREVVEGAAIDDLLKLLPMANPRPDGKFVETRKALLQLLSRLRSLEVTEEELNDIRNLARVQRVCTAKDWNASEDYEAYQVACKNLRDLIDSHQPRPFDEQTAERTAGLGLALLRLTHQVVEQYEQRKQVQGKLDFDDLLARAYALITDPKNAELSAQLSRDLCLLLVDEFQDTDELQANLVKALCGSSLNSGRLFFVGDFKQSIYRFRGAEPNVFRNLRAEIQQQGRLPLTMNFRSQPAILHFVNALFQEVFDRNGGDYEALQAFRPQTTAQPAVEFLWTIAENKNSRREAGAARKARRAEARAIARRLRALLDPASDEKPVVDKETNQPRRLRPGDVAILFRALSDVEVYEDALREVELDYYLVGGHAFYAQQEIYDVLNLLRAVSSSADEVSLAGVLRSPFFALHDETLFWLVDSAGSLNAGLLANELPPQLSNEEQAKVAAAAAAIRHLRNVKDRVPIATLLGDALKLTGYDAVLLTEYLGERKLANLHKLLESARLADHGGSLDLDGFITQLAQFTAQQPKESLAATLPEAADVIRLMTIHHAKGLEFPLVIVPDLDRPPNFQTPPAALHRELGPLVSQASDEDDEKIATGMDLFSTIERAEELEERKRLLYVACTRAADYLILSSSIAAFDRAKSDWMKLLAGRFDLASGELTVPLPEGYQTPQIRVTTEMANEDEPASRSKGPDLTVMLEEARCLAARATVTIPAEVAPIPVDHAARRQLAVSHLNEEPAQTETARAGGALADEPFFDSAIRSPQSDFGLLVHGVLARMDFSDASSIIRWCELLAPQHVLLNVEKSVRQARELVERFIDSPHGHHLACAEVIHREVEFLLAWPPNSSRHESAPSAEKQQETSRFFHGYIDCLYQDTKGDWRLVEYKTNNIVPDEVPAAAKRYELQLYVYALAAECALGRPPVELVLYFLHPAVPVVITWNDDNRRRAVELVSRAIAANLEAAVSR